MYRFMNYFVIINKNQFDLANPIYYINIQFQFKLLLLDVKPTY